MALTPLPALDRTSATFKTDLDTYFLTALPAFSSEANALQADVTAKQVLANAASAEATNQAALAANQVTLAANQVTLATLQASASASSAITAGASLWVSGTTYAVGNARYSPINGQTYRRLTAGAGTTDPSADATNWQIINGLVSQNVQIPVNNLPAIRPSLDLDFANSQTVDPRITFTRASTATRTNARGLIEAVASGVPRLDFDAVTGACKGLLIEEQRTNLLTYSEAMDNAAWTKTRATATANATTAPDGTLTAESIVEDTTASSTHVLYAADFSATNTTLTASVYAKAGGRSQLFLEVSNFSAGFGGAVFNLATGVAGSITNSGDYSSTTATIASVGNGWYRCAITTTKGSFNSVNRFLVEMHNGSTTTYTGDGTSGLFIWGAQLEAGAFPTSYIPTVASQVTRAADVASMTGANFSSWYRQDEGSLLANFSTPLDYTAGFYSVFSISDGTANNRISAVCNASGNVINIETFSSGTASTGFFPAYSVGSSSVAIATKSNDANYAKDGIAGTTDASVVVPAVGQLNIGSGSTGGAQLNGHLRSVSFYPKRLTNAELQSLSTQ